MPKPRKLIRTRWRLDGKEVKAGTPGAEKVSEKTDHYYGFIRGRPVKLSRDKGTAERMLRKLLADLDGDSAGLALTARSRPLAEHLADYERHLRTKGNSDLHVRVTMRHLEDLASTRKLRHLSDLSAEHVTAWLEDRRTRRPEAPEIPPGDEFRLTDLVGLLGVHRTTIPGLIARHGLAAVGTGHTRRYPRATVEALIAIRSRPASVETVNHFIRSVRAFCRWAVETRKLTSSPVASIKTRSPRADRRHDRRDLGEEGLNRLLDTTRASKRTCWGLSGEDRYFLYLTAMATGFRARALAGLTPELFALEASPPTVTLPARLSKNKRGKSQPIPKPIAAELVPYIQGRPDGQRVWAGGWHDGEEWSGGAVMLRSDLKEAGIPYVVQGPDGPLFADFHALRHSYLSALGRAGVPLPVMQHLAGHSTPVLTMRYTHSTQEELARQVDEGLLRCRKGTNPAVQTGPNSTNTVHEEKQDKGP